MSWDIVYTAEASIVRIMYGGRDIRRQLSETEMEY